MCTPAGLEHMVCMMAKPYRNGAFSICSGNKPERRQGQRLNVKEQVRRGTLVARCMLLSCGDQ